MPDPDDSTPAEVKQRLIKLAVRTPIFKLGNGYYSAESIVAVGAYNDNPDTTVFQAYVLFRGAEKSDFDYPTAEARDNFVERFSTAWKEALTQLYQ